ncbi:MAG TPA: cytochrome b N-terminal domain-containing protein [Gemmatimonadaceae bacterium]|nr:cytochrome b N-terminal domain-containing protein [Gemmatimonadaceae bacterium]
MADSEAGMVRVWLGRVWADIKASTDASLLGLLRFLGLLYGPIDTQLPIDQAFRKALRNRLPRNADWRRAFGGITYLLFIILVATGVLLSFYYRPSAEEAYQSVQHIVGGITLGWLMRDMHRWCANLIVVAVLVHMARVFFSGAYKPPRETNWLVGLFLLFTILLFGATGYLLPWDQWAYWTTTQGIDAMSRVPLFGGFVADMFRGDPIVSGATLSRFFAVHVILLPWIALGLLMLHFTLLRKHAATVPDEAREGVPFYPNHLLRTVVVGVLVIAFAMTAAVLWPRAVAAPADPAHPPTSLQSTWLVADVSRALAHYLGAFGFVLFIALGIALAVLPLFDRSQERRLRRRPLVAGLGLAFFLLFTVAWLAGRHLRSTPSSEELVPRRTSVAPRDTTTSVAKLP